MVASNQAINHYFYMAFHPIPTRPSSQDRMTRYLDSSTRRSPRSGSGGTKSGSR